MRITAEECKSMQRASRLGSSGRRPNRCLTKPFSPQAIPSRGHPLIPKTLCPPRRTPRGLLPLVKVKSYFNFLPNSHQLSVRTLRWLESPFLNRVDRLLR
jgi:hypothetical protein